MAGKGNAIWDYPIRFNVTMYTDDDNTFKKKRLVIKIKASTPTRAFPRFVLSP